MPARSKLALVLLITGCRCASSSCPDDASVVGHEPPQGLKQWCQRQADDGGFVRHGVYREWFPNGQLMETGSYRHGQREGAWSHFFESGQPQWQGEYLAGARTGRWRSWSEDGMLVSDGVSNGEAEGPDAGLQHAAAERPGAAGSPTSGPASSHDDDPDHDEIAGARDNCPQDSNPGQEDLDLDRQGDACDDDQDGDRRDDVHDNCPRAQNWEQVDTDGDKLGDPCDDDLDGDDIANPSDNCPALKNPDQLDSDHDRTGDACEARPKLRLDSDGDGLEDPPDGGGLSCKKGQRTGCFDNCPGVANPDQTTMACHNDGDVDGDGISNLQDNCLYVSNPTQAQTQGQPPLSGGDACHMDADGDGVPDMKDNCALVKNPDQKSTLGGPGDVCVLGVAPPAPASP